METAVTMAQTPDDGAITPNGSTRVRAGVNEGHQRVSRAGSAGFGPWRRRGPSILTLPAVRTRAAAAPHRGRQEGPAPGRALPNKSLQMFPGIRERCGVAVGPGPCGHATSCGGFVAVSGTVSIRRNWALLRLEAGTPGGIRTHDLRFRKPLLYPAELPGQQDEECTPEQVLFQLRTGRPRPRQQQPAMGVRSVLLL